MHRVGLLAQYVVFLGGREEGAYFHWKGGFQRMVKVVVDVIGRVVVIRTLTRGKGWGRVAGWI